MSIHDKVTEESKANIILLMTEFINSLGEDDTLFISGESKTDTFSGKGKKSMYCHAEKKID
jgi:hypothetical protein